MVASSVRAEDPLAENAPPEVALIRPQPGETFLAPADIWLVAEAADRDDEVVQVEFFANGDSLGLARGDITVLGPGPMPGFSLHWREVGAGDYTLVAVATDSHGLTGESEPVQVMVEERIRPEPPIVTLEVLDEIAWEQDPALDSTENEASVVVRRSGSVEGDLTVYWLVQGTAEPGVDYEALPAEVTLPDGHDEVVVTIRALDDPEYEPKETVVLALVPMLGLEGEPPVYHIGRPAEGRVFIVSDDEAENRPPRVAIVSPPDGAVFAAPAKLMIAASAADWDGKVVQVEFLANGESIGVVPPDVLAELRPMDDVHPEWEPIDCFRMVWENPPSGVHVLTAVATDDDGASTESMPVEITILDVPTIPVVTVEASDAEGAEGGVNSDGTVVDNPAVFTLHRTGPADRELMVQFRLGGNAVNGEDYELLPYEVIFPEGEASVDVVVLPIDDELPERTEKVLLTIVAPPPIEIFPPPEGLYWVGRPGQAGAVILDNDEPANLPPVVELIHPHDGEVFRAGHAIVLKALAGDRDGEIVQVEFFAGERSLGLGEPDADLPKVYRGLWSTAPAGDYAITAVATDNEGLTQTSRVAHIKVVEFQRPPVVTVETLDGEAAEAPTDSAMPADPALFRVLRTGPTETELTVYFQMRGSAENGIDYREVSTVLTFGVGEEAVDVEIMPLPDDLVEGPESVVLALMPVRCLQPADDDPSDGPDWRCPGHYVVGEPSVAKAVILDDDEPANRPPRVVITEPDNGQVFKGSQDLLVVAAALDADGWVSRMEFYAGDELIHEMELQFIQPPEPGQDQTFEFVWESVPVGVYGLRAKAFDNEGATSWSGPVRILVCPLEPPVVVTVVAADPLAVEPGPDGEMNNGAFVVHRRGHLEIPITVHYAIGGTAKNGGDYEQLAGEVTIPEGRVSARIPVIPLPDDLEEDVESVVVELLPPPCITIHPPPPECYRIGELDRAVVKILDRSEVPNRPPHVELVRPRMGDVFQAPAEIKMVAMATDRDGRVVKVEFYADGAKVGEQIADNALLPTSDFEGSAFTFVWETPDVGRHVLHAVAIDDDEATRKSRDVAVTVVEPHLPPVVRLFTTDPFASERPEGVSANPAWFMVHRTGSRDRDLTVYYSIEGTAANGEDYQELSGRVTIPEGRRTARIQVEPINDNRPERVETVVLRLELAPTASPLDPYRIGIPAKACAVIVDNDHEMPMVGRLPDGGVHLCLPGERGNPYRVEASHNMIDWAPVMDAIAGEDGKVRFAEPAQGDSRHRFYRLRRVIMEALPMDDE